MKLLIWTNCVVATMALLTGQDLRAGELPSTDAGDSTSTEATWDVQTPTGPTFEQPIDTSEGTWMSLDVSPDGTTIAFDLLGDLYLLPIEGGEASRLTSGVAWDMQPRFSPDGKWIAFTSDRTGKSGKGGDNIWIVSRDGQTLRQITDETYRLVNGPCWSPDGQYIVARKHFTSRRSLGSGEMWMYHVSGVDGGVSEGLQLTEKPTEQKDVNEPAFSPDGRYLYFSEDVSPGQQFEYNKDSNKQIYAINRLELETGEQERYIAGPGGSCRPVPAPDGRSIAFVRRAGPATALHIFDVGSGAVRRVYDDLERDMQEAWAIHGVYPNFAWMPDGRSVVLWARGLIRRIDIESGEATVIPFRVNDSRTMTRALRVPIEVAPDEFETKMLRWVEVAPAGDRVAYQALGHIYTRALPSGQPTRLTSQTDHFEFYPSWSRDGRHLVYVTWNDDKFGSVRIASADGGEQWTITNEPGHYIDPVFSPDGEFVVFQKIKGGWLRSPHWGQEPGIYRIPTRPGKGQQPELITRHGSDPQFGDASDRLFLIEADQEKDADNRKLISIDLDGQNRREHFTSTWATDYCLSPDGRWIAFIERFNVYLAPFVQTGRTISIGPNTAALPVAKVSHHAGQWIHFSGDGSRLYWSLGPELFERDLAQSFAFIDGAPEELPEPPAQGMNIGFTARHDAPRGRVALVGGTIITMNGDEVIRDATVVIEGNRIVDVGPTAAITFPRNTHTIDISGRYVLPGFVDTHAHGAQATAGITPQRNWLDYAQLSFGVTTIHDPSNDTNSIFAASEMTRAGVIVAPRTFSTGTILYGASGAFKAEVDSLEDAEFHLQRMKAVGAFSVKSYNQPRRDQRQQVVEAARQLGMMVVPEGGSTYMHNLTMIVDGHTGIEHTVPVELLYDDALDLWRGTGVGYTPTLGVAYGGISGENYWYDVDDVWRNDRVRAYIPPHVINPRARRREKAPYHDYNHFRQARITKQLIDIGETVQAGGHGQLPGLCTHWEMWMFVQGGMTPHEALRSGTLHGAQYLGLDGDIGSIERGKLADLIVLETKRNPLDNIRDTEHIEFVVANGRVFNAMSMDQLWPESVPRGRMFWEQGDFGVSEMPPAVGGCAGCGHGGIASWAQP